MWAEGEVGGYGMGGEFGRYDMEESWMVWDEEKVGGRDV